ncbi:DNA topoisomerase 3 [Tranquillimonas alkanivorans]|uniref:DNA topoisomerase n=1 Tax=Tranquillimonas alkanivorans TaxID=441119 RepID=A0A1I5V0P5_9RHOB|nr:DNA topoisomerase 3 [Tranquillimonas alkanivorans]SFQ01041.1 DNA topoisomerase-3 [Tranquillimonas alkanivorans]
MTTLYLCEKPDQGRIISQALGGGRKSNGGIEGDGWIVTWAFGHLLTPYMPDDYDEDLKRWNWETLPIVPEKFLFKPKDSRAGSQVKAIRSHMRRASKVVIATDADREGELIAYEILNELKWKGATARLWLSDLTIPAVTRSLASLREASETKPLYHAAAARMYADWIVGMNLSRAATLKMAAFGGKPLSVGRVQTPVLALIVDLERKITGFKPQDFFEIVATAATQDGDVRLRFAPSAEERLTDRAKADSLLQRVQGARGPLSVKTEAKKQAPPKLLDLATLQGEANSRFAWSADKALAVLQACYEKHQILTYPRTDCRYLPDEHKENIPTIAKNLGAINELAPLLGELGTPIQRDTVYNDAKITAHHAIIPTNKQADLSAVSEDERKLYIMVARFWCAAHMPDLEYLQTTISMDANGVPLRSSGRQITKPGWRSAFAGLAAAEDSKEEDDTLPPVKDGAAAQISDAKLEAKKTQPPARFTEKSLLKAMESVARYVDDPKAKATLKETSGIGTPATRAATIEVLKARGYVQLKKRSISPTDTGCALIDALKATAPAYADPVTTARWEDVLSRIATGSEPGLAKKFLGGIQGTVTRDVAVIKGAALDRMAGTGKASNGSFTPAQKKAYAAKLDGATPLKVSYDQRERAKALGARWDAAKKCWVALKGVDLAPFRQEGFCEA